jgi:hypothetical protein
MYAETLSVAATGPPGAELEVRLALGSLSLTQNDGQALAASESLVAVPPPIRVPGPRYRRYGSLWSQPI